MRTTKEIQKIIEVSPETKQQDNVAEGNVIHLQKYKNTLFPNEITKMVNDGADETIAHLRAAQNSILNTRKRIADKAREHLSIEEHKELYSSLQEMRDNPTDPKWDQYQFKSDWAQLTISFMELQDTFGEPENK